MSSHRIQATQLKPGAQCLCDAAQWLIRLCDRGVLHGIDGEGKLWHPSRYEERSERFAFAERHTAQTLQEPMGLRMAALVDDVCRISQRSQERADLTVYPAKSRTYRLLALLGRGSTGKVFKTVDEHGNFWALKQKKRPSDPDGILRQEASWMQQLAHPGIVVLQEIVLDEARRCTGIVMPLAACTLADRMKSYLSDRFLMGCLSDLQKALSYLHVTHLVHLDVKPLNIFLYDQTAVLGDLGSVLPCGERLEGLYACTRPYRPPEVLLGCTRAYYAMDAWSFGLVCLEMATQTELSYGKGGLEQTQYVVAMLGPPQPVEVRAMMAPWQFLTEAVCHEFEAASTLWKSDADRARYWEGLEEQSCCKDAFALAKVLLVYDSGARRSAFDSLEISRPRRRQKRHQGEHM